MSEENFQKQGGNDSENVDAADAGTSAAGDEMPFDINSALKVYKLFDEKIKSLQSRNNEKDAQKILKYNDLVSGEILKSLRVINPDNSVIEARILYKDGKMKHTGWYVDMEKMSRDLVSYDRRNDVEAIYLTLNPVDPSLIARAANRIRETLGISLTSDEDIIRRRWLPIDLDPKKKADISTTEEEFNLAVQKMSEIVNYLSSLGWSKPVIGVSGNGIGMLYPIDLPANDDGLVKRVIEAFCKKFNNNNIEIDGTVFNPARLWKIYGTMTRKGDNMVGIPNIPDRPNRRSKILYVPDKIEVVTREQLEDLIKRIEGEAPPESNKQENKDEAKTEPPVDNNKNKSRKFEDKRKIVEKVLIGLKKEGIECVEKDLGDKVSWDLNRCPFNSVHHDGAFIRIKPNGAIIAGCQHKSCSESNRWGWKELRTKYDPDYIIRIDAPSNYESPYILNDLGNSERFADMFEHSLKYNTSIDRWYYWNGKMWVACEHLEEIRMAKKVPEAIMEEANEIEAITKEAAKYKENLKNWANRCGNEEKLRKMLKLAESHEYFTKSAADFYSETRYFNCQNGLYDTVDMKFLPHDKSLILTRISNVVYDPEATCPQFLNFLDIIFEGDQEMIKYVQRIMGYILTGKPIEQAWFFFFGKKGANGKSTFCNTIVNVLGENQYAMKTDISTFLTDKKDSIPSLVAGLAGYYFIWASEPDEGKTLSMSLIKQFTGNEPIRARFMYEDYFAYFPQGSIFILGNVELTITEKTPAAWRRVQRLPFTKSIPVEERDKDIEAKLKSETPGIFNWMLEGLKEYRELKGLNPPEKVKASVKDYEANMNTLKKFLDKSVTLGENPDDKILGTTLYNLYKDFCEDQGFKADGKNTFNGLLRDFCEEQKEKLFSEVANSKYITWKGITMKSYS